MREQSRTERYPSAALLALVLAASCGAPEYRFGGAAGAPNDASTTQRDGGAGDANAPAIANDAGGTTSIGAGGSDAVAGRANSEGGAGASGGAGGAAGAGASANEGGSSGNGGPSAAAGQGGAPSVNGCDRAHWIATASSSSLETNPPQLYNPPIQAIDGDAATRWSSGRMQSPGQWFAVDLGALVTLTEVRLDTLQSPTDAPVQYQLELSADGAEYQTTATGPGTPNTIILFAATRARYVRVTETGSSTTAWWSIHEIGLACTPL